jgi:hypothetical protein
MPTKDGGTPPLRSGSSGGRKPLAGYFRSDGGGGTADTPGKRPRKTFAQAAIHLASAIESPRAESFTH